MGVTPFRVLITLLINDLLSPLPLQVLGSFGFRGLRGVWNEGLQGALGLRVSGALGTFFKEFKGGLRFMV